jgi:ParB family chromosome partitioning protein
MSNPNTPNNPSHANDSKKTALGKGLNSLLGFGKDDVVSVSSPASAGNSDAGTAPSYSGASGIGPGATTSSLDGLLNSTDHLLSPAEKNEKLSAVVKIKITDIEPNPQQPRKIFEDDALKSLSASIAVDGVVQPLIVSKSGKPGKYILIAGERRWRASKLAGLDTVPVIIKEASPEAMLRIALIENIQRADLNIVEEAEAYQSLITDFGLTQDQCAKKVGKERSTVANALRLLALPAEVQNDLMDTKLSMGHGRALLSLEDKKLILRARDIVIAKQLNVRQTEQLCRNFKTAATAGAANKILDEEASSKAETNADMEHLADAIRNHLRTKVKLVGDGGRGKIEVSYFSAAELERIIGLIGVDIKF